MAVSVFLGNYEDKTKHVCNPNNLVGRHLVKMDDKEANDRLMAAEAMSALSSLVLVNHKLENGPTPSQTRSRTAPNTQSARKKPQRKAGSGAVGKPKQTKHAKTQSKSKNKLNADNDLIRRHSTSANATHNDTNVIPKVMNETVSRKVVNDFIVNTSNYNNNNSNVDSANVQVINSGISTIISADGGLPLVIDTKNNDAFVNPNIPAALTNSMSVTATKTDVVAGKNITTPAECKTVSQSTQCTQTMPSEDILGVGNLKSLSNLISGNLLSQNFAITSLPSFPSIDALKLTAGIDLSNLPQLSTVNNILQNLNSGVVPAESGQLKEQNKEEDRSLPFKKRRYATNQSSGTSESDPVPGTSTDQTAAPPTSTCQSDTKHGNPARIAPLQTECVALKFDPTIQTKIMSEIAIALQPDEDGDLPLHIAVVHENIRMIKKFIQLMKLARKSVDKFNKQKLTPLHLAIKLNLVEAIKLLLDANADVNYVDHTGCTSLHLTVKHQLPHLTQLLFEHSKIPVDVNTRNFSGVTPLHTAVDLNNEQIINILIDEGVDIDAVDGKSGRTALYHAVECKKKEIVSLLLHRGANAEIQNYAGNTAIMASQARNYDDISRILTNGNALELDTSPASADNVIQSNSAEVKAEASPTASQVKQDQVIPGPVTSAVPSSLKNATEMPRGLIKLIEEGVEGADSNNQVRVRVIPATEHMVQENFNHHIPSSPIQAAETVSKKNGNGRSKMDAKMNKKNSKLTERQMATTSTAVIQSSPDSNVLVSTVTENNDSKCAKEGVKNLQGSVKSREKLPATILNARTPVIVPTGIQSYINPDLRAKIQQNLKNKRLKAQLSEEKQD